MSAAVWQETQWADPRLEPPRTDRDQGSARCSDAAGRVPPAPRETRVPTAAGAAVGVLGAAVG